MYKKCRVKSFVNNLLNRDCNIRLSPQDLALLLVSAQHDGISDNMLKLLFMVSLMDIHYRLDFCCSLVSLSLPKLRLVIKLILDKKNWKLFIEAIFCTFLKRRWKHVGDIQQFFFWTDFL